MRKVVLFLISIFLSLQLFADSKQLKSLQGALTYRIMHFTNIQPDKKGVYNICIDGDEDVYEILKKQLQGKTFADGKLNVTDDYASKATFCSLLFLGERRQSTTDNITKSIVSNKLFVLTSDKKMREQTFVIFKSLKNKIVFEVNKTLMEKYNIKLSSKVLRLANRVY